MKRRRLVEVIWDDAVTGNAWVSGAEADGFVPARCKTAGYLVKRTKAHVTIASTIGEGDDECNAITTIPRPFLKSLRYID